MGLGQESDLQISMRVNVWLVMIVLYLQLVLAGLRLRGWVEKINCENLCSIRISLCYLSPMLGRVAPLVCLL